MGSNFTCISASAGRVDLDTLFKTRTGTARQNVGFKVGGVDLAQRYEASTGGDTIGFSTYFKSGSSDLSTMFRDYNYAAIIQYLLSVYSGSGSGLKNSASYAPITASAAPSHFHFDQWTGATVVSPTSAQTTIYMDAAKVVSASYAVNEYVLTVTNGTGDGTFGYFATMSISADAAPSYQVFNNWSNPVGDLTFDNNAASTTNAHFASDNNATAEAVYNWINYTVQAINGSGGTSTVLNGDGSGNPISLTNNNNQQYTLVANPSTGYYFVSWLGNTAGVGNTSAASTYIVVTGNAIVTSSFAAYTAPTSATWSETSGQTWPSGQSTFYLSVTPSGGTSPFYYDWWISIDGGAWSQVATNDTTGGHDYATLTGPSEVTMSVDIKCQGYPSVYYTAPDWFGTIASP